MSLSDLHYYQPAPQRHPGRVIASDVCIYGGTVAGVVAAVQLRRLGHRVVIAEFGERVGGMSASGLGATDIGNKHVIGGMARQFYRDLGAHYGQGEAWLFEPSAAEALFRHYLREADVPVHYRQHLATVRKNGNEISEIEMEDGTLYRARVFLDAGYEGDLLARAGVSYRVGREGNDVYGETYNGIHFGHPSHNFHCFVDPYQIAGDPRSGLCHGISDEAPGRQGEGDCSVQAYNFRVCLSDRDDRLPLPCPDGYDPERYTLLRRYLKSGYWDALHLTVRMPNGKTDTNNFGAFSSDNIGRNHGWPEGSYAERERLFQDHVGYNAGLLYFLVNDPGVPEAVRADAGRWGLPCDEFTQTGGWPHQLYVREARRMVSDHVVTEHDVVGRARVSDGIGMAAYGMDSHNCRRLVLGGRAYNEGNVEIHGFRPYPISYRSLRPREEECANLLVPWCVSASHIAFGSVRMEPVSMILGQSAACAAALALRDDCPVQHVDIATLQAMLRDMGQILDATPSSPKPMVPLAAHEDF